MRMGVALLVWCLVVVVLLAGAFPSLGPSGVDPSAVFGSPVFALLLAVMGALLLRACLSRIRMFPFRRVSGDGFLLAHLGLAVLLAGAGVGLFAARDVTFFARVSEEVSDSIPVGKDASLPLGFGLALTDFEVDWYPAYALQTPAPDGAAALTPALNGLQPDLDGRMTRPGETTPFSRHAPRDGAHGWLAWRFLPLRWLYTPEQRTARLYRATMRIVEPGQPARTETFVVNRPLEVRGWRFFIMNYHDSPHGRMVGLRARRDPGRPLVIAGIWMLIVGVALLCWCPMQRLTDSWALLPASALAVEPPVVADETLFPAVALLAPSLLEGPYLRACLGSAALGYGCAALSWLLRRPRLALSLFCGAWLTNLLAVLANWLLCGHPPLGNMYHVLVVLSLCFLPQYLLVSWRRGMSRTLPLFAAASVLPLIGTFFMRGDAVWLRPPVLQSPWFVPHVLSYMISYATCAVAFLLLLDSFRGDEPRRSRRLAEARTLIRLALPLMTFGLWSGALWAEEAWGVYWSWDPKETWALITWLLYLLALHVRLDDRGRRWERACQLAAFVALLVTFLVVNLLPKFGQSMHSYAR
ncbi:MAG: cytochrome c biogenesis protein CcsA [Oligosphaeraceae bacterium]